MPDTDTDVRHRTIAVGDVTMFYREAGPANAPHILLLHGFGTSSFMFRNLIPRLATKYHVVAPDLPGFGRTEAPPHDRFAYDFDRLADVADIFTELLHLDRYAVYVFDYGAPVGFRLAVRHPDRVTAIVSQNGNAYVEGLSPAWSPIQAYWREPTPENRDALRGMLTVETTRWQYETGTPDLSALDPDAIALAQAALDRPGNADIQLDLFGDYKSNVALYPAFQSYFRDRKPPLLAVWGKNDPFFLPAGAEAYKRDNPNAEVLLFDAGHMALETAGRAIGSEIMAFLGRLDLAPA